jgi:hypothetical protein
VLVNQEKSVKEYMLRRGKFGNRDILDALNPCISECVRILILKLNCILNLIATLFFPPTPSPLRDYRS